MSKRVTTKEFIGKARAVHGDRYDYSAVHYVAAIKDVKIICLDMVNFLRGPQIIYLEEGAGNVVAMPTYS